MWLCSTGSRVDAYPAQVVPRDVYSETASDPADSEAEGWVTAPTMLHNSVAPPRDRVGPYRLEQVIGAGGMGVVYQAVAPDGTPCAVKTLRADCVDPKLSSRFAREASVRIEHPNVIRVLDSGGEEEGPPYIVFELLNGENLEHRLAREPIAPDEAVGVLRQAAEGVAAIHDAGILHRDLKPANLFLCTDGTVKVLDFGIAALAAGPRLTATGSLLGTPAYLSPEQAQATTGIDTRSDIWALGAVLYEALSGQPPFTGDSFFITVLAILTDPVPALVPRAGVHVPPGLFAIVKRCLAKNRDARFPTARALAEALAGVARGEVGKEGPSDAPVVLSTGRPTAIPPGEERVVVVLLAAGVHDPTGLERVVREHGGEPLTRFGGSSLGLFGGTQWMGDEAERAVEAAIGARRFADRVAVASGRASSDRGSVAGAAVSAAERGCGADLAGIAVDPATARTLVGKFTLEQVAADLFEVVERREESWAAAQVSTEPEVLGREAQAAQLRFALETALGEERAMIVSVTGPAGIGKTALCNELTQLIEARPEPIRILLARAEPLYQGTAWSFLASLLRRRAAVRGAEPVLPRLDPDASIEQRRDAVLRLTCEAIDDPAEAMECAEFLGEVLGVPMPQNVKLTAARQEPLLMADRIRLAFTDWLVGHARRGPIALLLDNADWADDASLDVIEHVVEELEDTPLIVFVASRRRQREGRMFFGGRDILQVALKGIGRSAVGALAARVAGKAVSETVVDRLVERTDGNPLFVRELVMALLEQGRLDEVELDRASVAALDRGGGAVAPRPPVPRGAGAVQAGEPVRAAVLERRSAGRGPRRAGRLARGAPAARDCAEARGRLGAAAVQLP